MLQGSEANRPEERCLGREGAIEGLSDCQTIGAGQLMPGTPVTAQETPMSY